jgi:streptogramin lyase
MIRVDVTRTAKKAVGLLLLYASGVGAQEPAALPLEAEQVVHAREFGRPWALEVGPDGRLYATYPSRQVIRIVDPATGSVETVSLAAVALDTFPASIG